MESPILRFADAVWRGSVRPEDVPVSDLRRDGVQEIAYGVAMWPACGNVYVVRGEDGLALFDTGDAREASPSYRAIRKWSAEPLKYAIFSRGRADRLAGLEEFDAEPGPRPLVVAQEGLVRRLAQQGRTAGYNATVDLREQGFPRVVWPLPHRLPDLTYRDRLSLSLGDVTFMLTHAHGATDDATWAFLPERGVLLTGDLFAWTVPGAGDPQRVQGYPDEWAVALRAMAALDADLLLPGRGLPICGSARVRRALADTADYLDSLVEQTLDLMNSGARLDEILHEVKPPPALAARVYLREHHDEPEFIVRNIWRLHGGWHDGNPANLKPAPDAVFARAVAELSAGAASVAGRAVSAAADGDLRLACQLAELAAQAEPDDHQVHEIRALVYALRVQQEPGTIARGVYAWAAAESRSKTTGLDLLDVYHDVTEGRVWWLPVAN
ncbi:alkyl sulfatase dimerization domain-containing protein [Microbispora amethystogenes]|uniref:Alkyl sulfatase n=1 Tax=Microbispora amethystogenes TaxID=1427754 RepID=A0ABQ4FHH2_9ACTN|nr:alkyl sulfatase dimerization domain-containing protein [Microbispora amethystogenes]GIH34279.1 alkyl sulfatase [Microbispora amethystogenes]